MQRQAKTLGQVEQKDLFIYLFKLILSVYHVPEIDIVARDTEVRKTHKHPCFLETCFSGDKRERQLIIFIYTTKDGMSHTV